MFIGDKLLQLRKEKGYSQEQLANVLNVSRQAVSKWEAGTSIPELEKLILMADIFEVSVDYLVRKQSEVLRNVKEVDSSINNTILMEQLDEIKSSIKNSERNRNIYEYKSKRSIYGIPLVHVRIARNGNAVARGIIAIGNVSIGVLSIGVIALGLISFGGIALGLLVGIAGLALGVLTIGGVSIGVMAFGGVALGIYAVGGVAAASKIAIGGVASGQVAIGQVADGAHTLLKDTVTTEQARTVILDQFPKINRFLLKVLLTLVKYMKY